MKKKYLWIFEDRWVMWVFQLLIVGVFFLAALKALLVHFNSGAALTMGRGELSLTWLTATFAAAVAICIAMIQVYDGKYKVALTALDLFCITYLFFFSDWFVNSAVYNLLQRVSKL